MASLVLAEPEADPLQSSLVEAEADRAYTCFGCRGKRSEDERSGDYMPLMTKYVEVPYGENMPLVENAMQLLAKRSAEDEMESPTISFVAKKLLKKYAPLEEAPE